ncbi:MAG: peptidylprolyl isomerase [Erythrobacter sp.]
MSFNSRLRLWLKEPLVHFLIGGLAIYLLFAWRGEPVDPASRSLDVSREDQAQLSLAFEKTMGRAPTDAELDRQVQKFVREEVLYREALRLGLDVNDGVVRRRMAQKMDLIAGAQAETAQPSNQALEEWYDAHPERFADDAKYTFDQIFKTDLAGAKMLVEILKKGSESNDFTALSDPISLPKTVENMSRKEVLDRFGEQMLRNVDKMQPNSAWEGPIQSGFGFHLVRLKKREVSKPAPFDELSDTAKLKLENDWRTSTIADRKKRGYTILREAYEIEIAE